MGRVKDLLTDPVEKVDVPLLLIWTSKHGGTGLTKLLCSDLLGHSRTWPLCSVAVSGGQPETAKLLLADARIDPTEVDDMLIRLASKGKPDRNVQLLSLNPRVDSGAKQQSALGVKDSQK